MSEQWSIPAWLLVALVVTAAAVLIALATVLLALVLPARRAMAAARSESGELGRRLAEIEQRLAAPGAPSPSQPRAQARSRVEPEFVITHLGESAATGSASAAAVPVVPPSAFLDLVLRETAVQAGTLAIGLRRALSPESRNRIRFEMRREVKRARRQRRLDTRTARREWEARQRAAEQEPAA